MEKVKLHDRSFKILITHEKIQQRVSKIALEMNETLKGKNPLFICILNGAFMFTSDLFKKINIENTSITFFRLSSYQGITTTGKVIVIMGFTEDIKDRNVVVVEDIVDTGITINEVVAQIEQHKPKSVRIASLLFKPEACKKKVNIDYLGFEIPDEFIVGYGLDYDGLGRNLPDIYVEE